MAISVCNTVTDSSRRELTQHGNPLFPIAAYEDDLSLGEVPWHWHEELEVVLLTQGAALVAIGTEKKELKAGEGFFINRSVLHAAWQLGEVSCRFHSLVFHSRLVGGSVDSIFWQKCVAPLIEHTSFSGLFLSLAIPWQQEALLWVEDAWQQLRREEDGYELRIRDDLSQLLYGLCAQLPELSAAIDRNAQREAERIKAMLAYIHQHYSEELTLGKLARCGLLSESQCLRCFRSAIAMTPMAYVRHYRIQKAAELLQSSEQNIAPIAEHCGFSDPSYFTKLFRQQKGCTPGEYRRKYR
ncbi:MAG: helix-turn-helix transcriptional regulator [Oscillospiraceae bacterium]|nr:helix-turn-helix transcriptional regulator [Oscillospiraceae bacterium]